MSEDAPEPARPLRPIRRLCRWLRRLVLTLFLVILAAGTAAWFALAHLDLFARWAIERAFPGVTAEITSLHLRSADRLEAGELELRSARTKNLLLRLEGGTVSFTFGGLWQQRIEELRLNRPDLHVSPALGDALGIKPAAPRDGSRKRSGGAWSLGRVIATDGTLTVAEFGTGQPEATMVFALDLHDFGIGGAAGAVAHSITVSDLVLRVPDQDPLLTMDRVTFGFTTDGLFSENHLDSLAVGRGDFAIDLATLSTFGITSSGTSGSGTPFSAGRITLDHVAVAITGLPAIVRDASFILTADLQNLGTANDDEQILDVAELETGSGIVTADAIAVRATTAGLTAGRLAELRLVNPAIRIRGEMLNPTAPGGAAFAGTPENFPPIAIDRLVSDYGTLAITGLGATVPDIQTKFAFNLTDAGLAPELAASTHEITVWDTQAAAPEASPRPFLTLDLATVTFTPEGLLRGKRIEGITVNGGQLTIGEAFQSLLAARSSDPAESPATAGPTVATWTVGTLDLKGLRTRLEDARVDVSDIDFTLNSALTNVALTAAPGRLIDEVQTVEFANLEIPSPINPAHRVFTLRSVFVRFTLGDLARQRLREVVILRPTIYLSQDLFVYMERATAPPAGAENDATLETAAPSWRIDRLEVKFGSLVIGSGGSRDVGLPIGFETVAANVAFDDLASLELDVGFQIPTQSYSFSSYQLELEQVGGDLQFSYPPDKGEKNVVQKLDIERIRWRQYEAGQSWIAVTFDSNGINGTFGGDAYAGYVNGGFSFFFQTDSPWIGWVAGTGMDTAELTGVISPQNFRLTGPVDFEVQIDAFQKNIDRMRGAFTLTKPGRLTIGKLDDLLAQIPDTWPGLKRDTTRIALETLRDFDYTDASGDFWFVQSQGILTLNLTGPQGSRVFEAALHDGGSPSGRWQTGALD